MLREFVASEHEVWAIDLYNNTASFDNIPRMMFLCLICCVYVLRRFPITFTDFF